MQRLVVGPDGAEESLTGSPPPGGWVWSDLLPGEATDPSVLRMVDPSLLERSGEISLIPQVIPRDGQVLCILHSLDADGHLLQLGIVTGTEEIVSTHRSFETGMDPAKLTRETAALRSDLLNGILAPDGPRELAALLADRLISSLEALLLEVAGRAGALDRRIREENEFDSEARLEELFDIRHDLYTLHNRLRQNALTLAAADEHMGGALATGARRLDRLVQVCEGERDFLQGVLDYYEQRVNMKMNFAMERLAVVTVIVLPITAVSGILGMNTIASDETKGLYTMLIVLLMGAMVGLLLHWTKKKDWW